MVFWKRKNKNKQGEINVKKRLDDDLLLCNFTENMQKGFLFFLGGAITILCNKSPFFVQTDEKYKKNFLLSCVNAYSDIKLNYEEALEGLDTCAILNYQFSTCHILENIILKQNKDLRDNLRNIPGFDNIKALSTVDLNEEFISTFSQLIKKLNKKDKSFNLSMMNCQILQNHLFENIGQKINDAKMSHSQAYAAGFGAYQMHGSMDLKFINYIHECIILNLTPLYAAICNYPMLYIGMPDALKYNHLFSHILQHFAGGLNPNIYMPIHAYHQAMFYRADSSFNSEVDFEDKNVDLPKKISISVMYDIRKIPEIMKNREVFIGSDIMANELKNIKISGEDFYKKIKTKAGEKYGFSSIVTRGEYIQLCAVLFYEMAVHAVVVDELTN